MTLKFQTHRLEFPPELAGRRLDQALAALLPQYSRTRIQRWIEEGAVRVNGLAPRARDVVVGGEAATVEARQTDETAVAAEKLPLDIVHQDTALIVINTAPVEKQFNIDSAFKPQLIPARSRQRIDPNSAEIWIRN